MLATETAKSAMVWYNLESTTDRELVAKSCLQCLFNVSTRCEVLYNVIQDTAVHLPSLQLTFGQDLRMKSPLQEKVELRRRQYSFVRTGQTKMASHWGRIVNQTQTVLFNDQYIYCGIRGLLQLPEGFEWPKFDLVLTERPTTCHCSLEERSAVDAEDSDMEMT